MFLQSKKKKSEDIAMGMFLKHTCTSIIVVLKCTVVKTQLLKMEII